MIDYEKLTAAANGDAFAYAVLRDVLEELAANNNCQHSVEVAGSTIVSSAVRGPCNTCIICLAKRWVGENKPRYDGEDWIIYRDNPPSAGFYKGLFVTDDPVVFSFDGEKIHIIGEDGQRLFCSTPPHRYQAIT